MNKSILIIILLLISGLLSQGIHFSENDDLQDTPMIDTSLASWKTKLNNNYGLDNSVFEIAIDNYLELKDKKQLNVDTILTIIDFSKSSVEKRLFILDIKNQKVIKTTWVAHGKRTGIDIAEEFSNKRHSNKSSLGAYITSETYFGKHGYSLRLDGMSKGLNDNARKRAIVIHGADYVSESFIKEHGRLGRSFGCPALPQDESKEIIDLIKNGSCFFIYHPSILIQSQSLD